MYLELSYNQVEGTLLLATKQDRIHPGCPGFLIYEPI